MHTIKLYGLLNPKLGLGQMFLLHTVMVNTNIIIFIIEHY